MANKPQRTDAQKAVMKALINAGTELENLPPNFSNEVDNQIDELYGNLKDVIKKLDNLI